MNNQSLWKPVPKDAHRDLDQVKHLFAQLDATSTSTSPITAQRLEPEVMPIFVDSFPLYDLIEKVPSNGLSHTFLQQTAFSQSATPHTISETGTVADDANVYLRKTSNIMQLAIRRGVTLKAQYAGANAGGASQDLMGREIAGGLLTIARDAQAEILQYQDSDTTSTTVAAPNGAYDANGVNGLRYVLNNFAPPENNVLVDIRTPWTDQRVLVAVRQIVANILDKGGKPDLVVVSSTGDEALFKDQMEQVRFMSEVGNIQITPGLNVRGVGTQAGLLPVLTVPGAQNLGLGSWTNAVPATYVDIFVLQTDTLELPYLGAPEPTIIRVPIGTDGQLRELAIPFVLLGLACKAPSFLGRVSLRVA